MSRAFEILVSCGEASGDLYASELLKALREREPSLMAFGLGGDRTEKAGCELTVHFDAVSVLGLVEVVRKLPSLHRAMSRLENEARRRRPDAAVLIDFSGFNLRLARRLQRLGVPILYYVSPQVWAWRRGRLRVIRETVDRMVVILPFEEVFYRKEGIDVRYVGHPLVDLVRIPRGRESFCESLGLDPRRPIVAFLPGSRRREVELHLPVFREAVETLSRRRAELQFVVSRAATVVPRVFIDALGETIDRIRLVDQRTYDALAHAAVAVVASGTATVEAALAETPLIVVYRLGRLSYALGKPLVRLPHYSMVNLVAGRRLVPELIQKEMTPDAIVRDVLRLLDDPEAAEAVRKGLREVKAKLGGGGASERAAEAVLSFLRKLGGDTQESTLS